MSQTKLDELGLSVNQRLALEYIVPGQWFSPDSYFRLRYVATRNTACKALADKGFLLKRPFSDLGYMDFEYCLTVKRSKELGIVHREIEAE